MVNSIDFLNKFSTGTLMEALQIRFCEFSGEMLVAEMPVNSNTIQPYGFLHGGATVALAESVGGALSLLCVDQREYIAVGIEINANHLLPVMEGVVKASATFLHKGNSIHVVDIRVTDAANRLVCVCRLTNKIVRKDRM